MYITKQIRNFAAGTVVYRQTGATTLVSGYDAFHGWYDSDDGYVTPADLIGCECSPVYETPKEVSFDNGRTWYDAQMVLELIDDELDELVRLWDAITAAMDDDIREIVHNEFSPCSRQEFLAEYLRRAERDIVVG